MIFFRPIEENVDEFDEQNGFPLVEEKQINFLEEILEEMEEDGHFEQLHQLVSDINLEMVNTHGLYGSQLRWKLSNISFSFTHYINQRTASLFERLLSSIGALLDSILGAVPDDSAVKELKEAIRNSLTIATK